MQIVIISFEYFERRDIPEHMAAKFRFAHKTLFKLPNILSSQFIFRTDFSLFISSQFEQRIFHRIWAFWKIGFIWRDINNIFSLQIKYNFFYSIYFVFIRHIIDNVRESIATGSGHNLKLINKIILISAVNCRQRKTLHSSCFESS